MLAQTYSRWEQIIVDDGSTDGTQDRVARFNDPRIRYIRLPHRGISALAESYNVALAAGRGDLVAVLEGDDFWPPDKLAMQVPAFNDPEVQISWGKAIVVDEEDRALRRWPRPSLRPRELAMEELFQRLTSANILTPTVTVMTRRSALDAIGGFHQTAGALFVDLPTWLEMSARVRGKARMLDEMLGYYRVHQRQMSAQYDFEYHTTQSRLVAATVRGLDPFTLERLGWNDARRRTAEASAQLAAGYARLRQGRRREARSSLLHALRNVSSARERLRAGLGLASTFLPVDLVGIADATRRRLQSASLGRNNQLTDIKPRGN